MPEHAITWRTLQTIGEWSMIEFDVAPGRTGQAVVLTSVLSTPVAGQVLLAALQRHEATKDQLREGP